MESFFPIMHGATRQTTMLGDRLAKRGVKVIVITRRISKNHAKEEDLFGCHVYRVPPVVGLNRYGKYLMILPTFFALMRRSNDYDILVVSDFKVLGIIAVIVSKILGKKCMLRSASRGEMDGSYAFAFDTSPGRTKRYIVRSLVRGRNFILGYSDVFLSIASVITDEIRRCGIRDHKIFELKNGVDTFRFCPVTSSEKETLRARLNLPDSFLFIYSGRIAEGKGLSTLLNVWKRLILSFNHVHLLLVGSGQGFALGCEEQLKQIVKNNKAENTVTFTGHVDNVFEYLQASDCFVFPTEYEALSNTLLEATSCGLPCIATRTGGNVEIIDHEENGLLFDVNDEEELFRLMKIIVEDRDRRLVLGQRARRTAVENFNIDEKIIILESLMRTLVQGKGP